MVTELTVICTDVSFSCCHGSAMVMVLTVICVLVFLRQIAMALTWLWYWLWYVFWCFFLILPWNCHGYGTDSGLCSVVSSSYCDGTAMVMVLTVVCVRMFLPHIAMVLPWLWYGLWYVFWCFFLILPWYCHGNGTDCGLCSDASSSYCYGTAMVMVLTVVCVLMLLPHIAMVLPWLWYWLWSVFWRFFLILLWYCHGNGTDCGLCSDVASSCFLFILPWYCHGYGTDCGLCSDVSSSYCHGTAMVMVLTVVFVLMFLPHIAMVLSWLWYWLWSVFWCFFLILPWYCHGYGTGCGLCSDVSYSYCHDTAMFIVLTVVCLLMFLPQIAMVLPWLWYWLWYVFGCFFLILPWYCHGYGSDCGMCSDVSSSYCHGTVMVMVLTVVCVLMFLPHIAMVLPWLCYGLWSVFWCFFLILPWYCHGYGTDCGIVFGCFFLLLPWYCHGYGSACGLCSDVSSSYCYGTAMVMVLTVVFVLMFLPHIAMVLPWLCYGLWSVFWCCFLILPWYCHGYGTDCGLCSDVSSSYCYGTAMVMVLPVVCVLMFLPHIAMVLPWLWYWLWFLFWCFFLILPWYCHGYVTDFDLRSDVSSSYCHGSAFIKKEEILKHVICINYWPPLKIIWYR